MRFSKTVSALLIAFLAVLNQINQPVSAATHLGFTGKFVKGEVIVRLKRGMSPKAARAGMLSALQDEGTGSVLSIRSVSALSGLQRVKLAKGTDVSDAVKVLRADPAVEFAEPNYILHAFDDGTPNDPMFPQQWSLKNTGQPDSSGQAGIPGADIQVTPLWAKGIKGDKKVLVAVIDTGVDYTHPDLVANVYTNPGEIPDNGIDDDKNGYIDDVHGWNTLANNGNSKDDHGHGSHCAGIIGASGDNGIGISGINHSVSILPVKFLSAEGSGSTTDAIKAIEYARKMKVRIMSNSWGGSEFSQALKEAIDGAKSDGILFVAAAGNEGVDLGKSPSYPAAYASENIVAVAATDNRDQLPDFSNFGKAVHLAAPGVRIVSTTLNGTYQSFSGSSMAAPHVAGVAALLASVRPDLTAGQIKQTLIETSDPMSFSDGKELLGGRLNALKAVSKVQ